MKEVTSMSQRYQRYNLVPPDADATTLAGGEGEDQDDDDKIAE